MTKRPNGEMFSNYGICHAKQQFIINRKVSEVYGYVAEKPDDNSIYGWHTEQQKTDGMSSKVNQVPNVLTDVINFSHLTVCRIIRSF